MVKNFDNILLVPYYKFTGTMCSTVILSFLKRLLKLFKSAL